MPFSLPRDSWYDPQYFLLIVDGKHSFIYGLTLCLTLTAADRDRSSLTELGYLSTPHILDYKVRTILARSYPFMTQRQVMMYGIFICKGSSSYRY